MGSFSPLGFSLGLGLVLGFACFVGFISEGGNFQVAETMGSSIEVLREQMTYLLEQGLHDSAEMLVRI